MLKNCFSLQNVGAIFKRDFLGVYSNVKFHLVWRNKRFQFYF